ncbi:MAG: hypothetical protein JWP91_520 [Fibrobacteres bacterium]|nr:hypothetical protein [Fibrobacterota bacterium]
MATIDTHPDNSSVLRIIKDLRDDTTALFRQEVALAKREIAGKAASFGKNTAMIAVGALIGLYAVFFLFLCLNNLIQAGLHKTGFSPAVSSWFAPLILGMILGVGALVLALKSLKAMRKEKAVPQRTLDSIREDKDWIKGKLKG